MRTRFLFMILFAALLAAVGPAGAQTPVQAPAPAPEPVGPQAAPAPSTPPSAQRTLPQDQAGGAVRPIQAFFAASLCRMPPGAAESEAKRQCYLKTRMKLTSQAAGYVGKTAQELGYSLSPDEIKAFADTMLDVSVVDEGVADAAGAPRVQISLEARDDEAQLAKKLAFYAENANVRQKAVAEYRLRDTGVPGPGQAAERAAEVDKDMRQAEKNAQKYVRAGMNLPEVVDILGEPRAAKEGAKGEGYLCASYGRIWVVFKDGLASCLRTRLEYHWRHGSDCHCAGNLSTIIPLN